MSILEKKRDSVKKLIFSSNGISRRGIADKLDLDFRTVASYTGELERHGYISEKSCSPSGKGRPTIFYFPQLDFLCFAGIQLRIDLIKGVLIDMKGGLLTETEIKIDTTKESKLTYIQKILELLEYLEARTEPLKLSGVGIAYSRWLVSSFNRDGLHDELAKVIKEKHNVETWGSRVIDSAVFHLKMSHDGIHNIALIHLGTVVELGLMLNDVIQGGACEKEFCHISLNPKGPACYCGNKGCIENYISLATILKKLNSLKKRSDLKISDFFSFCSEKDSHALILARETGCWIGHAFSELLKRYPALDRVGLFTSMDLPETLIRNARQTFSGLMGNKSLNIEIFRLDSNSVNLGAAYLAAYHSVEKYIVSDNQKLSKKRNFKV